MQKQLIQLINKHAETDFEESIETHTLHQKLMAFIDHLIKNNFNKLVNILYKVDVNETKLKEVLKQDAARDAAEIIAELIITREMQKIESREKYKEKYKS